MENACTVKVLDPAAEPLADAIHAFDPDIIGITSYTVTYPEAIEVMRQVRKLAPKALCIIGGVHISSLPQSLDEVFDAGVIGEGEQTLLEIVRYPSPSRFGSLPGICYHSEDGVTVNPPGEQAEPELPIPRLDRYAPASARSGSVGFITSRGCPFKCTFCYSPVLHRKVRYYPPDWIAGQFEYAVRTLKAHYLMLLDDTVCLDSRRLEQTADEIERRGLFNFSTAVNMRSSAVSDELCRALERLHVVSWNCGFESGSNKMLKKIKGSSASVEKHYELVEAAYLHGVRLNGSFIFGMPGETPEDMEKTLEFMGYLYEKKCSGRYRGGFWFFCAAPFPGTQWWHIAAEKGRAGLDMDFTCLDIKNFDHHLLLEESIKEVEWRDVIRRAGEIVEKANKIF
ncbi:MAG: B12-binding domain-containing radical SAM protein [Dehalococcoidaceae bacterium]|nr:B12-binding domain-containing radical SAM protein [Dehalococcoidaceae bacterium]